MEERGCLGSLFLCDFLIMLIVDRFETNIVLNLYHLIPSGGGERRRQGFIQDIDVCVCVCVWGGGGGGGELPSQTDAN